MMDRHKGRFGLLSTCLILLVAASHIGCATTRQQTALSGEVRQVEEWGDHEVLWVETREGAHIEFDVPGGRIRPDTSDVGSRGEVVGVGTDGVRHHLPLADITLLRLRSRQRNVAGEIVAAAGVTVVGVIIMVISTFRT